MSRNVLPLLLNARAVREAGCAILTTHTAVGGAETATTHLRVAGAEAHLLPGRWMTTAPGSLVLAEQPR